MAVKQYVYFFADTDLDSYPKMEEITGEDNLDILLQISARQKEEKFPRIRFHYGPELSWQWFELWWLESGKLCPDRTSASIELAKSVDAALRLTKIWGEGEQPHHRYRLEAQVIRFHKGFQCTIYYAFEKRVPRAQLKIAAPVWDRIPAAIKWAEESFPEGVFRGF